MNSVAGTPRLAVMKWIKTVALFQNESIKLRLIYNISNEQRIAARLNVAMIGMRNTHNSVEHFPFTKHEIAGAA